MALLELCLDPEDVGRLALHPDLHRTSRATTLRLVWHDTAAGDLAAGGSSLAWRRQHWRLERLVPGAGIPWPPASPAPLIQEGSGPLPDGLPAPLAPVAMLEGRSRSFRTRSAEAEIELSMLEGELRGVTSQRRVCRVQLSGAAPHLRTCAIALAQNLRVSVPRWGLAAEAIAVATGQALAPRHVGAPEIVRGQPLSDSIARIVGQLLDVLLHWSAPTGLGVTPHPVHQMRVATRRLRSALSMFKAVAPGPELVGLGPAIKDAAARLGAARDWDVFLDGTGARILAAFPDDKRVRTLLAASRRRRDAAYDDLRAYLTSATFRELEIALGCAASLRPWEGADGGAALQEDTALFAAQTLTRRWRRVRRDGRGIATLTVPALHELRKDCKRLRYAAEFFQKLFPEKPARRFIKHLSVLQEELGLLNDGAVAAALMARLGRAERGYAAGLVGGFVAASTGHNRAAIDQAWKRFRSQAPFWTHA